MLDNTAKDTKPKKKIVACEYLILLLCLVSGIAPSVTVRAFNPIRPTDTL